MTIDELNTLYARGLYNPINYYLGLFSELRAGADLDDLMSRVPTKLLARLQVIAARHQSSPTPTPDLVEVTVSQKITGWRKTDPNFSSSPGSTGPGAPTPGGPHSLPVRITQQEDAEV
jgi:hypothetical protein